MKACKKILSVVLVMLILISSLTIMPVGATTWTTLPNTTMELTASCDYTSAFEVLEYLNAYRVENGLEELVMDEELLECAMQRAAELSVNFSHTRPDGTSWIRIHDNLWAENAAKNVVGSYYVVEDWKGSSGHNYNMLLDNVTAVGIGAIVHNGIPCWIQLFATEGESMDAIPENTEKKFSINLGSNTYKVQMETPEEMKTGEVYQLQVTSVGELSGRYGYVLDNDSLEWTSSNPEVATVADGLVTAVGEGTTTVSAKGCVEITKTISVSEFSSGSNKKCGDNITWNFAGGVLTLSGYGDMYDYCTTYDRYNDITSTDVPWYDGFECVKKVVVGEGITSVGDYSFTLFTELEEVVLPDSLESIGGHAFQKTYIHNTIDIPENVSYIGEYSFERCSFKTIELNDNITELSNGVFESCSLEYIYIPDSVTVIGDYAFNNCRSLKFADIPDSVTTIGKYAFADCWSMNNIDIPSKVSTIDECAFSGCPIEEITILKHVEYLGSGVVSGCDSLEKAVIEDGVESIPASIFKGCVNLTDVTIPESVTEIKSSAFYDCKSLREITLPSGLRELDSSVFYGCSSLEEIVLPSTVDYLSMFTFYNCEALSRVTVLNPTMIFTESTIFDLDAADRITFACIKNSTTELMCKKKGYLYECCIEADSLLASAKDHIYTYDGTFKTEDLRIDVMSDVDEYDVLYSYGEEFDFNNSFESLDAMSYYHREWIDYDQRDPYFLQNAGVYPISYYVYSGNMSPAIGCVNIIIEKCQPEFYYEEELVRIPWRDNTSYGRIYDSPLKGLGDFYWSIAEYTSSDENIVKVSVNGDYSASGYGEAVITATTRDLENFEVHTASFKVQTYPIGTFPIGDFTVYVTEDGVVQIREYKGTDVAPVIPDKFYDLPVTEIRDEAFRNSFIESIVVPEGITKIRNIAFLGCENLKKVVLPDTLETISSSAFFNCNNLKEITIPESVTFIGNYALGFYNDNGEYTRTGLVINGYSGSEAEKYAEKFGVEFKCLDAPVTESTEPTGSESTNTTVSESTLPEELITSIPDNTTGIEDSTVVTDVVETTSVSVETDPAETTIAIDTKPDETVTPPESTSDTTDPAETTSSDVVTMPSTETLTEASTGADETESSSDITEPSSSTESSTTAGETKPTEPVEDKGILGDVNGDGKVNIKDATMIQKAAAKILTLTEDENIRANVNGDKKVNVKDATAIQKFVAKIETGFLIGEVIVS